MRLSKEEKQLIVKLYEIKNYSPEEIAQTMDRGVKTIRNVLTSVGPAYGTCPAREQNRLLQGQILMQTGMTLKFPDVNILTKQRTMSEMNVGKTITSL